MDYINLDIRLNMAVRDTPGAQRPPGGSWDHVHRLLDELPLKVRDTLVQTILELPRGVDTTEISTMIKRARSKAGLVPNPLAPTRESPEPLGGSLPPHLTNAPIYRNYYITRDSNGKYSIWERGKPPESWRGAWVYDKPLFVNLEGTYRSIEDAQEAIDSWEE